MYVIIIEYCQNAGYFVPLRSKNQHLWYRIRVIHIISIENSYKIKLNVKCLSKIKSDEYRQDKELIQLIEKEM